MPPDLATVRAQLVAALATLDAMEPADAADPWLDMPGASEYAHTPRSTLERWARAGDLRAVQVERGRLLTRRSWLDQALERRAYVPRAAPTAADDDELAGTGLQLVRAR